MHRRSVWPKVATLPGDGARWWWWWLPKIPKMQVNNPLNDHLTKTARAGF
jgi:hypothetical protein